MKKRIIEPFRIKTVEPLRMTTREERVRVLEVPHLRHFTARLEPSGVPPGVS